MYHPPTNALTVGSPARFGSIETRGDEAVIQLERLAIWWRSSLLASAFVLLRHSLKASKSTFFNTQQQRLRMK